MPDELQNTYVSCWHCIVWLEQKVADIIVHRVYLMSQETFQSD